MTRLADRVEAIATAASHYPRFRSTSDIIDLAAGDPVFATPESVGRAGIEAIERNVTKYTDTRGTPALRAAIRDKFARENDLEYDDAQVIVGLGSKQVLANALLATVEPGDEVILLSPCYGVFAQMVAVVQGRPVVVQCRQEDGFRVDPTEIAAALSDRTAWLILNNPVNPTGVVYGPDELAAIAEVVLDHPRAGILSDEIYEHITFGQAHPASIAAMSPEAFERTLTVNGVSKAYSMTGWRIGYGGGSPDLIAAMARIQSATTSCASAIGQAAAHEALTGDQGAVESLRRRYEELCEVTFDGLGRLAHLTPHRPDAGLYVLAACGPAIGMRAPDGCTIADDVALVEYIDATTGVRIMPGSVFGLPEWIRVSFAVEPATMRTALERIGAALEALR